MDDDVCKQYEDCYGRLMRTAVEADSLCAIEALEQVECYISDTRDYVGALSILSCNRRGPDEYTESLSAIIKIAYGDTRGSIAPTQTNIDALHPVLKGSGMLAIWLNTSFYLASPILLNDILQYLPSATANNSCGSIALYSADLTCDGTLWQVVGVITPTNPFIDFGTIDDWLETPMAKKQLSLYKDKATGQLYEGFIVVEDSRRIPYYVLRHSSIKPN